MSLALAPPAAFTLMESNVTAPATAVGTVVTAGGSANTYNTTWTELIASTAFDAYAVEIWFCDVGESLQATIPASSTVIARKSLKKPGFASVEKKYG